MKKSHFVGIRSLFVKTKVLIIIFFYAFTQTTFATSGFSQTTVSLNLNNVEIRSVIKSIEKQTEYRFFYIEGLSDMNKKVSINANKKSVEQVLNEVLSSTHLGYKINENKTVIIAPKETMQQQGKITGIVTDINGEPLVGVSVVVKGTSTGVSTNINGQYTLDVAEPNALLTFSYLGYRSKEEKVASRTIIDMKLEEDAKLLDEVVVVGYGTQKKVNLTGSVSTISAEKIESRPVPNISSALSGLAAGVSVMETSGDPMSSAKIRIRGTGTFNKDYLGPMVIVDGTVGTLDIVNPDDVESISILKDAASASIYGSRAANGVVLVTTKKGKKEAAPRLTYSGMFSSEEPSNTYSFLSDYTTYMEAFNRAQFNMNQTLAARNYSQETIDSWRKASQDPKGYLKDENGKNLYDVPNWVAFPNTDWNKALFTNELYQKHNLSLSGGSKNSNYLLSFMYMDNPGTMENTGVKRYQMRVNLESKVTDFLKVGTQTYAVKNFQETGNSSGAFTYMFQTVPGITPFYNGKYGYPEAPEESFNANNLLWFLNDKGGEYVMTRMSTTWYATLNLFKGLTAEGRYNYQGYQYDEDDYSRSNNMYSFRTNTVGRYGTTLETAKVKAGRDRSYQYTRQATLNYSTDIKNHSISALVGYEDYYYNFSELSATKRNLMDFSVVNIGAAAEMDAITGTESDYGMVSYLGRLNYSYKSRYLFEANIRRDGSSRFGPKNRWGTFPSISGAWRISEEPFMVGTKNFLDNLKLRASWGELGNTTSSYYAWQATYAIQKTSFGGKILNGLAQDKLANSRLHWENVVNREIGIDALALRQRLSFEVNYYNRITEDILTAPSTYLTLGDIKPATKNTSDMRNQGFELNLGWNDRVSDFSYSVGLNFAYNQNKIISYLGKLQEGWVDDGTGKLVYKSNLGSTAAVDGVNIRTEGHMIDEIYVRTRYKGTGTYKNTDGTVDPNGGPRDGMIRTPQDLQWVKDMKTAGYSFGVNTVSESGLWYGEMIMADLNGDKIYGNTYDRKFTNKSATPKYTYGVNLGTSWKGFDLNMQWAGQAGMYYYLYASGLNGSNIGDRGAMSKDVMSSYYFYNEKDPNDPNNNINAKYSRLKYNSGGAYLQNDYYLYNASYIKLKSLQLGYTFPKQWVNKVYINNLRLFVVGENLLTITDYPGLDPELGSGINVYPISRQYSVGINLTF